MARTKVAALDGDRRVGAEIDVTETPTFLVGLPTPTKAMRVVQIVSGAAPLAAFDRAVAQALAVAKER
jgi:predicted DsbA family dithiol-disulfide isomerase